MELFKKIFTKNSVNQREYVVNKKYNYDTYTGFIQFNLGEILNSLKDGEGT